jgi:hypothetical protein
MEQCQIVINIPSDKELADAPRNKTVSLNAGTTAIKVWRLDSARPVSARTLSMKSRPRRLDVVDVIQVKRSEKAVTKSFTCPTDTLQTFEFECVEKENCLVDFWQDKFEPNLGRYPYFNRSDTLMYFIRIAVYLLQSPTAL